MAVTAPVAFLPEGMVWERSFGDVACEFVKGGSKDMYKMFLYGTRWLDQLFQTMQIQVYPPQGPLHTFKVLKNGFGVCDLPEKFNKAIDAYYDDRKTKWDLAQSVADIMNPFVDGAELVNTVVLGSLATAMPALKAGHSVATLIGSAIGTHKGLTEETAKTEEEKHLNWVKLGRNVSYLVVGAVGTLSLLVAIKAQEIIILVGLTAGLGFTVYGFFYERMVNPTHNHELLGTAGRKSVFKDYVTVKTSFKTSLGG